jgi:CRISPR-associated protein Cst2
MIGTFMAVEPARPTEDFGVMSRGIGEPVLHEHQFFTADLAAPFLLDLSRVGTFTLPGQSGLGRPNYLDGKTALKAAEAVRIGATSLSFRGQTAIRLPLETRRERVALLLEALAELTGGAKKTLHYGDRIPALVALVPMSGGVNPLGFVINGAEDGSGLRVQADVLRDELAAWDGEWEPPVRFGWRPGFRGSLRAEFVKDLSALGMHERVTIEHPRTMLRGLAAEIRAGDHEAWFEDRVR